MSKPKAIICDLDGTLFNIDHRLKYIDGSLGKKDWNRFYSEMEHDTPNEWCQYLLACMLEDSSELIPLYVTGRPDKYMHLTNRSITGLFGYHVAHIFMRKEDDFRKDSVIKKEIYYTEIKDKYDVIFCLEDRKQVVDMWRKEGLVCLQCAHGEF